MKKVAIGLLLLLLLHGSSSGQSIIFNDPRDLYEIVDGTCTYKKLNQSNITQPLAFPFSLARFKDTIYILMANNDVYRSTMTSPDKLVRIGHIPTLETALSFCADKHGSLYGIAGLDLYRYNPHSGEFNMLGTVPQMPGGDMLFYKDTLMYISESGVIAVNMKNPSASQMIIPIPGYYLVGIATIPVDCTHNKLYGIGTAQGQTYPDMLEIDPETRSVTGPVCHIPYFVLDAASQVEDGTTLGVTVDSIDLQSLCGTATTGGAHIFAYTAANGDLTYTLDGIKTNTTGVFDNLALGSHTVHITNVTGCSKDTSFTITKGLSDVVNLTSMNPTDCYHMDGSVDILASTGTPALQYSLNDGPLQPAPHFEGLGAGTYKLKIIDGGHCTKDTSVSLRYIHPVTFLDHVTVSRPVCTAKNGALHITLATGIDIRNIQLLVDGLPQSGLDAAGLGAGYHMLSIINSSGCKYDTSIQLSSINNNEPGIHVTVSDPVCLPDNGSVTLFVDGIDAPYTTSLDQAAYSSATNYTGIFAGRHLLSVMDKDGCSWDTTLTLHPYNRESVTIDVDSVNPDCRQLNKGQATIHVDGSRPPYLLQHNGNTYSNGSTISGLNDGRQSFPIVNADGCTVDSAVFILQLQMLPGCDTFYMPKAFTPNGDGNNDIFRPIHSPYLSNYLLEIYNRWGQRVYADKDVLKGWDGTSGGRPLPAGAYVWMIRYENFEKQIRYLKGEVLLLR
ncbi:MAG: gliding motility-associated C-terminal domain-containing protein [Chitinophagaceae bacterium]|nr:gliding motility-associated C-terminal domain-containing protein [Chitinophagaceae bacterium]